MRSSIILNRILQSHDTMPQDQYTDPYSDFLSRDRETLQNTKQPLSGIRVLELSSVVAAPFAAAMLGDAGAEVIKIENPSAPDALRGWGASPECQGIEPYYFHIGRNKTPITLNLKTPEGIAAFKDLIQKSDVFIENIRESSLNRLGLGHKVLLELNPGLVIGKITGYGMDGPMAARPGFGTLAESFSGFTSINGFKENGATSPPIPLADMTAGIHLAFGVSLALRSAKRGVSGGQVVDASLYEPLFGYMGGECVNYSVTGKVAHAIGNELSATVPRNIYEASDHHHIALSCSSQRTWENLARTLGRSELIDDSRFLTNADRIKPENRIALNQVISAWVADRPAEEVLSIFETHGVTAGPVLSFDEISKDEHYLARESVKTMKDPVTGQGAQMPNVPFRMSESSNKVRFPGLPMGAGNEVVFKEILKYDDGQYDSLMSAK